MKKFELPRTPAQWLEAIMNAIFFLCGILAVGCVAVITVYMFLSGLPAIGKIGPLKFLFGTEWASTAAEPKYGILPFVLSSIYGTLGASLIGVPVGLLLMGPAASSLVTVLAVCALWGCCATAFNVAFQAELIKHTPADSSAVAMSIFSGLFNLGIGTGTAIGGAVVSGPGIAWIGFAGGSIAVVGVILAITVMFPAIRRAKPVA